MNKLILNFFGEEVTIETPKTLEHLRKQISEIFFFSPSDSTEILVSYFNELKKVFIQTEQDFLEFIKKNIYKVDLDISPDSQLFKKSVLQLQEETEKGKKELEELIKKNDELKKIKNDIKERKNKAINNLNAEIKQLNAKKNKLVKERNSEIKKMSDEINKTSERISELQKKLCLPPTNDIAANPKSNMKNDKKNKKFFPKMHVKIVKHVVKKKFCKRADKKTKDEGKVAFKLNETINKIVKNISKTVNNQINQKKEEVEDEKEKLEEPKIELKEETKGFFDFTEVTQNINKLTDIFVKQTNELTNNLIEKYKYYANVINGKEKENKNEKLKCPAPKKDEKITCNGCGAFPIVGNRFKCTICQNFDFCEKCEKKYKDLHSHPLIKVDSP